MAGGGGGGDGEPEFQVAPMIDVLLVLLIFFISITSTQVLRLDQSIRLPAASNAQKKANTRNEAVVNIKWINSRAVFNFNDRDFAKAEDLVPLLTASRQAAATSGKASENPEFRIVLRGDKDCPAIHISRVMNAAAAAGIADICFSAANKE
jgi:biopolymer transport protein ExbD